MKIRKCGLRIEVTTGAGFDLITGVANDDADFDLASGSDVKLKHRVANNDGSSVVLSFPHWPCPAKTGSRRVEVDSKREEPKAVEEPKAGFEAGTSSWKVAGYILIVKMSVTQLFFNSALVRTTPVSHKIHVPCLPCFAEVCA